MAVNQPILSPAGYVPSGAVAFRASDGSAMLTDAANPLPARPPVQMPAAWANGATPQDLRTFDSAVIQVVGLSGGDTIAVSRSIDGTNFVAQSLIAADFSIQTTIAQDGVYSMPAQGYIKYAKTGSASAPVVTLRAGG